MIKAFTKGTEGIMVSGTGNGKLVVTAGTYDLIPIPTGGSITGRVTLLTR